MFDTCGTGGDRAHTFNVSTVAALVLAACGVRVAKHGNRSVSSRCGSADLFEALGVNVAAEPAVVERCLEEAGIAFFFAPTFHPSMRHAGPTRRELGVRTAFNLLGPLTNPAGAARQLVGVPRPELTELVARSLALLGTERAWVVHGADGLDEISTTGYTKVSECRDGAVNTFYLHPADVGLPQGGARGAARRRRRRERRDRPARAGRRAGPARDIVLLNAAAALLIAGTVDRHSRTAWRWRPRRSTAAGPPRVLDEPASAVVERRRGGGARHDGSRHEPTPDLLATIVAATRAHRRGARPRGAGRRAGTALRGEPAGSPTGAAFERALRDVGGAADHRRVQAPVAVARHPARRLRPGRARARVRGGRRGRDLGAHRADVLRRRARAPRARCGRRSTSRSSARTSSSREYQLLEAAALGADAVLLIVAALDDRTLRRLLDAARRRSGWPALVEVHDADELARALDAGARDRRRQQPEPAHAGGRPATCSTRVAPVLPPEVTAVAESGIRTPADIARLSAAGYDAFLVGERLITQPDPGAALRELRGNGRPCRRSAGMAHDALTRVKVCGDRRASRGRACSAVGARRASALGFVFWPRSPRCVDRRARAGDRRRRCRRS